MGGNAPWSGGPAAQASSAQSASIVREPVSLHSAPKHRHNETRRLKRSAIVPRSIKRERVPEHVSWCISSTGQSLVPETVPTVIGGDLWTCMDLCAQVPTTQLLHGPTPAMSAMCSETSGAFG